MMIIYRGVAVLVGVRGLLAVPPDDADDEDDESCNDKDKQRHAHLQTQLCGLAAVTR